MDISNQQQGAREKVAGNYKHHDDAGLNLQGHNKQSKAPGIYNDDDGRLNQERNIENQSSPAAKHQSPTSPTSPPSASSSPSHEFSFTISLHSSSTPVPDKAKTSPSFAIDLSPADDIFFHGHLLPLHLLSHLPVSPRSSTNSLDNFSLPARDFLDEQPQHTNHGSNLNPINKTKTNPGDNEIKGRSKSKSLTQILGLKKWRKGHRVKEEEEKEKHKRKLRFEVPQVIKKYARLVKPLLSFKGKREDDKFCDRQAYDSFSGNLNMRNYKQEVMRGRRGEYSAPASMRTSPTNSGVLVAAAPLSSSTSDSTMEELQAAIQAAIAHCKKSIGVEEKLKC